jgi:hypothetical protein
MGGRDNGLVPVAQRHEAPAFASPSQETGTPTVRPFLVSSSRNVRVATRRRNSLSRGSTSTLSSLRDQDNKVVLATRRLKTLPRQHDSLT